jgi:SAM-dependent methyltransferase
MSPPDAPRTPLRDAPATARNREPILAVLARWLSAPARVLEIASGTGQHAVFFGEQLPHVDWQPSDRDAEYLASIAAWVEHAALPNVAAPIVLDATADRWPVDRVDAVFNANMIHIAPWRVAEGLLAGAGRVLAPAGLLFLYGPFRVDGAHTSESNAAFDESLRARDPEWGVRDLESVVEAAGGQGLAWVETNELPANNLLVILRRTPAGATGAAGAGADEDAPGGPGL